MKIPGILRIMLSAMVLGLSMFVLKSTVHADDGRFVCRFHEVKGIGAEKGIMRRDPSDIIKVEDLYYVWYTKGKQSHGYDATIWYATSPDGRTWTEQGEAIGRGPENSWDDQSVFTPNILVVDGTYYLFYTAVSKPFANEGPNISKTAIGIAVSDSPDGPWRKLATNPILRASADPGEFDSMRVDDSCMIVRNGTYWLYYKGRQWNNTPRNTKMGVAIADRPEGPYVKSALNPLVNGGHEVLVWPHGIGAVTMIGGVGPDGIRNTLMFAPDGLRFSKMADLVNAPLAPGAYRPEAFTDSNEGDMIEWGLSIGRKEGYLPFLIRFECEPVRRGAETSALPDANKRRR